MTKRPNDIRWAFFGTPPLAALFLDDLEARGFIPSLVVTTPDRARGRGMEMASPAVKVWAEQHTVPVLQPDAFDADTVASLREAAADVFVVIYYGKILPKTILEIPAHGTLNVHFSLLPRWRGTSPVRAAIAADDRALGTSIIRLDEKVDHGPVVAQKRVATEVWPPRASEVEPLLTHESAALLAEMLPHWIEGDIEAREQNHDLATMCPAYEKGDGLLDLNGDPYQALLKIRAFDSTVGTYAFFQRNDKKIRVQILDAHFDNGKLAIDSVKPEGKRAMPYAEFLHSGARVV